MRDHGAEAYEGYQKMCKRLGHPCMTREAYEKELYKIPDSVVKVDAVLKNSRHKKDKK